MRKTRLKVKKMEITELQREEENAWDAYVTTQTHPLLSSTVKRFD